MSVIYFADASSTTIFTDDTDVQALIDLRNAEVNARKIAHFTHDRLRAHVTSVCVYVDAQEFLRTRSTNRLPLTVEQQRLSPVALLVFGPLCRAQERLMSTSRCRATTNTGR
eukprot:SAG11_NODE_12514_length_699_cov_1.281667_1_plen_111_part_10